MVAHRPILGLFVMLVGTTVADEPKKKADTSKEDLARLQGKWQDDAKDTLLFHTLWVDNDQFPHFHEFASNTIEVKGDKLRYGPKLEREITIILGAKDGKKTISFKIGDKSPIVGIYELDDAGFRVCAIDPNLGGKGKRELPEKCGRTRGGWYIGFGKVK